jgi:hypothetical protein
VSGTLTVGDFFITTIGASAITQAANAVVKRPKCEKPPLLL